MIFKRLSLFAFLVLFSCASLSNDSEVLPSREPAKISVISPPIRGERLKDLIIPIGQSNDAGLDEIASYPDSVKVFSNTLIYNSTTGNFEPLQVGVNNYGSCPTPWPNQMFGLEWGMALANEATGKQLTIIKFARYGASLNPQTLGYYGTLSKLDSGGVISHYDSLISYVNQAQSKLDMPSYRVTIIFNQGETDGHISVQTANEYKYYLNRFLQDFTQDCNLVGARIIIVRINNGVTWSPYRDIIRATQQDYVNQSPFTRILFNTDSYSMMPYDNAHWRQMDYGFYIYYFNLAI